MFTRRLTVLVLITAVSLLTVSAALAGDGPGAVVNGVWVDNGSVSPVQPGPYQAPDFPGAMVINFDDVTSPCVFADTHALREEYAGLGVHFLGNAPLNGGGNLNECGGFSVTGHSAPNFLAFNSDSSYMDGGIPTLPETITFDTPLTFFAAKMGSASGAGYPATLTAYGADGQVLGSSSLTLTAQLEYATISAAGIYTVEISGAMAVLVVDDIAFSSAPSDVAVSALHAQAGSPALGWPLAGVLAAALALGIVMVLRRR